MRAAGYETARSLAFGGAHVVFACRDLSLAREAMTRVTQERPLCKVSAMHLDLMRLSSVQKFSDEYLAQQWWGSSKLSRPEPVFSYVSRLS